MKHALGYPSSRQEVEMLNNWLDQILNKHALHGLFKDNTLNESHTL